MLIEFLKKNPFAQNLAAWVASIPPCMVEHNLGKYGALKRAFYLTALEDLPGDYLEFGVFTGSSFGFAMRMQRKLRSLGSKDTAFFGFDSFSGFGDVTNEDDHPFYQDDTFNVSVERVKKNLRKQSKGLSHTIVEGYFDDTVKGKAPTDLGITRKARIVFIDCDLKEPSKVVLEFVRPILQEGTILMMDDFYSYKGRADLGLCGAFEEFQEQHPEFAWRRVFDYGYGGIGYICAKAP